LDERSARSHAHLVEEQVERLLGRRVHDHVRPGDVQAEEFRVPRLIVGFDVGLRHVRGNFPPDRPRLELAGLRQPGHVPHGVARAEPVAVHEDEALNPRARQQHRDRAPERAHPEHEHGTAGHGLRERPGAPHQRIAVHSDSLGRAHSGPVERLRLPPADRLAGPLRVRLQEEP
jgi:hypothetical protein